MKTGNETSCNFEAFIKREVLEIISQLKSKGTRATYHTSTDYLNVSRK